MTAADGGGSVGVLYAEPDEQIIVELPLTPGLTAIEAVERSGLLARVPEIRRAELVLGVFGVEVAHCRRLQAGDRVEISRPLRGDPRDMRRELMTGGRVMGGAIAAPDRVRVAMPEGGDNEPQ